MITGLVPVLLLRQHPLDSDDLRNPGTCNRPAHSLGYRGHILTKSRRYSTTYGALREERADYRKGDTKPVGGPDIVTESNWRYVGSGYTPGEADYAAGIAEGHAQNRQLAKGAQEDAQRWGEWL